MNAITWILLHKIDIFNIVTSIVAICSAIAALTPTPKDDGFIKKAYMVVDWLALNIGKAKDK